MPRKRPRDKFGTSQGHPGRLGQFMWTIPIQGAELSAGQTGHMTEQMGHFHGTDGTHTRGCRANILYVYWFFLSPPLRAAREDKAPLDFADEAHR